MQAFTRTNEGHTKEIPVCVYHLVCTVQLSGHTGMRQAFIFAHGGASGILCKLECYTGFSLRDKTEPIFGNIIFSSAQNLKGLFLPSESGSESDQDQ